MAGNNTIKRKAEAYKKAASGIAAANPYGDMFGVNKEKKKKGNARLPGGRLAPRKMK